ncbi:MAG: MlaD family protein [Polaribacter sp.]|uniref:MlaD family protein n=1 Tax=Polaribacter sp. TaxID=1920175 RepID=UPI002F357FF6
MSKELKIGFIAVVIIALFIWGINFLKGENLLDGGSRYFQVEYSKIGGLNKASSVTINGLKVGKVDRIEFNKTPEKRGHLIVRFSVENDFEFSKTSIVKIYSPNPLSGSNLAIIPNYDGDMAISGDLLEGEMEESLFTSIGEKLNPIQSKLENVLVSADSLFKSINNVLDTKTSKSIKRSLQGLEYTITDVRKTLNSVNSLLDSSAINFKVTIENTRSITENLSKVSDTIANSNIGGILRKTEMTLTSVNSLLEGIDKGKGTLGMLVNDDAMYTNLTNVSKELEELLREMKLNPKRFVHFSLFGKRATAFDKENNTNNKTNK